MTDDTNIGGVNISDVDGGTIQTGDITTNVTAGGDVVGRDKITHYHLHFRDKQAEIKPPVPHLPTPYFPRRYALPANFTGRRAERQSLTVWLRQESPSIYMLVAMGGMGKSALAWYWLQNDVDPADVDGLLWWSFDESEASFDQFLNEAIRYVSDQTIEPGGLPSAYDRVQALVNLLQQRHILLGLDNFERQLQGYTQADIRPYDNQTRACLNPLLAQFLVDLAAGPTAAKLLLTTRLMVSDLEAPDGEPLLGCRVQSLASLPPADAVAFMRQQGVVNGTDTEIEAACRPYGYHPLSLTLLSGLIKRDKRQPGDIAVAARYQQHRSLVASQHEILATAYQTLPAPIRQLLSQIAALRGAVTYDVLSILNHFDDEQTFDAALDELIEWGLLRFDPGQVLFDLHPLVRDYAYQQLTQPEVTHAQLRDYFAQLPLPNSKAVKTVEDLAPVIELFYHTAKSGLVDKAWGLYEHRLRRPLYYKLGAYEVEVQLLTTLLGANGRPLLKNSVAQTGLLMFLSMCHERMGQLPAALNFSRQAVALNRAGGRESDLGSSLVALASVQFFLGELQAAHQSSEEAVTIFNQLGDMNWYGISHRNFGAMLIACGDLAGAKEELDQAEQIYQLNPKRFAHGLISLSIHRAELLTAMGEEVAAFELLQDAYRMALEKEFKREAAEALFHSSSLQLARGNLSSVSRNLETVLQECRRMRMTELEVEVLLALGKLHLALAATEPHQLDRANHFAKQAQVLAGRCGYRLKQANIHNFLARYFLTANQPAQAQQQAQLAREQAWCDGPPHTYQSALNEADRLLAIIEA